MLSQEDFECSEQNLKKNVAAKFRFFTGFGWLFLMEKIPTNQWIGSKINEKCKIFGLEQWHPRRLWTGYAM